MYHQQIFTVIFCLIISISSASDVVDFCVADLKSPVGPAGYPCKDPKSVTVDDFVYTDLRVAGNASNMFKLGLSNAIDLTFPGLNGLGLGMIRADIGVGGAVPLHSHRVSEIVYVVDGTVTSGFIASDNKAYAKTLNKGDVMIVPPGLFHFMVNIGKTPAFLIASWNSPNPGFRTITTSIGMNNLSTDIIQKTTLLDAAEIQKLKKMFGGK